MFTNQCSKCGEVFETKNPKRVICPNCLYPEGTVAAARTTAPDPYQQQQRPYQPAGGGYGGPPPGGGGYGPPRPGGYGQQQGGYQQQGYGPPRPQGQGRPGGYGPPRPGGPGVTALPVLRKDKPAPVATGLRVPAVPVVTVLPVRKDKAVPVATGHPVVVPVAGPAALDLPVAAPAADLASGRAVLPARPRNCWSPRSS